MRPVTPGVFTKITIQLSNHTIKQRGDHRDKITLSSECSVNNECSFARIMELCTLKDLGKSEAFDNENIYQNSF